MTTHVYLKYAIALLMEEYGLQTEQDITFFYLCTWKQV